MASRKARLRPKKPSFVLGFLMVFVILGFTGFAFWQNDLLPAWVPGPAKPLERGPWAVLISAVAAVLGWLTSAWVTIRNSVKQHTINTLLQSRLSAVYMENGKLINARYFTIDGIYCVTDAELRSGDPAVELVALGFVLNYLEFVAVGIRYGDLDEKLMKQTLRGMVCNVFEASGALMRARRAPIVDASGRQTPSQTFEHLQWLYDCWFDPALQRKHLVRA